MARGPPRGVLLEVDNVTPIATDGHGVVVNNELEPRNVTAATIDTAVSISTSIIRYQLISTLVISIPIDRGNQ